MSHYIAMFVALLWFCARLLCASLPTHQSCVKDTSASSLNIDLTLQMYQKLHLFNIALFSLTHPKTPNV